MSRTSPEKTKRIRELNDTFRSSFAGGRFMLTASVNALPVSVQAEALANVRSFCHFTADNDPHNEHDFGSFELAGETFFFKIDYYALDLAHGSEDPSDHSQTVRVLTLMLAQDY